ncbi:MAG: dihydrolipoyl dehydrogenase [Candidatus Neomarinimicrobiota bacterium]|jgi:dihydrolipoamide dehydrogenase|nr:dihydrolipoyl dehydrogenase [Candidatus Neomarinimicrobiota bacterium]MEE3139066.1 dihydrolipoyl dehydrogenase [Candidatus Neomarinimicrobiota bacterium]|tara:strand:- start:234 stop:1532 length:1299 start_codon:yes stop_codon:yes gene_type:complete
MNNYDLVVLGGGPGGYSAAFRAAELGKKTAIIDDNNLGGVCLNWGCIPTKSLLKNAEVMDLINSSSDYGISVKDIQVNFDFIVQRSIKARERLSKGIHYLVKKNQVDFYSGFGKFIDNKIVDINGAQISAQNFIIATGSSPKSLSNINSNSDKIVYSKDIFSMDTLPTSLTIIGAGAIGAEFAYFFSSFGTKVTLIEAEDRILPNEDKEISTWLEKAFKKRKINILTSTIAENIDDEKILISVGVEGNSSGFGLKNLGVEITDNNHIKVDQDGKTNIDNIYAVGDVIGPPWLAHVATAEGIYVAELLCDSAPIKIDYNSIPNCTYCKPEVASIGLTEESLLEQSINFKKAHSFFNSNGKAVAVGSTDGFIKILVDDSNHILGAHIIGSNATEMISEISVIKSNNLTIDNVLSSVHPHPTFSEAIFETLLQLK